MFIIAKRLSLLLTSMSLLCSGVGLFGLLCTSPSSANLKQATINDLVPFHTVTATSTPTPTVVLIKATTTPTPTATVIVTVIAQGTCVPLWENQQYPCEQH